MKDFGPIFRTLLRNKLGALLIAVALLGVAAPLLTIAMVQRSALRTQQ